MIQRYPLAGPSPALIERELTREAEGYNVSLDAFKAELDALLADKSQTWTKPYRLAQKFQANLNVLKAGFGRPRPGVKSQTAIYADAVNIAGGKIALLETAVALAFQEVASTIGDPIQKHKASSRQTLAQKIGAGSVDKYGGETDERGLGVSVLNELRSTLYWPIALDGRPAPCKRSTFILHDPDVMIELMKHFKTGFVPRFRPMLVPPKEWAPGVKGGYLDSKLMRRRNLVKNRPAQYRKDLAACDMPDVYTAVNEIQATAWKINGNVFDVAKVIGLDVIEQTGDSRRSIKGRQLALLAALEIAADVLNETIYFPHDLDWRGRLYSMPQFLSPQGADEVKALLTFAEAEPIATDEQLRWLMIHGANSFGKDKVSFDARAAWVIENEPMILKTVATKNAPLVETDWLKADDPFQFLAFCYEWKRLTEYRREHNGSFRGFESGLPVGMDGSCNGLQHLSAILRDPEGGAAVNLTPATPAVAPQDIYAKVADVVKARVEVDSHVAQTKTMARAWLTFGIDRKLVKSATMTYTYGQGPKGRADDLRAFVGYDPAAPRRPQRPRGYNMKKWAAKVKAERPKWWVWHPAFKKLTSSPVSYIAPIVTAALEGTVKAAPAVMTWLQGVAREAASENKPVSWITPVGFPVLIWKVRKESVEITSKSRNHQTRLHFMEEVKPVQHLGESLTIQNGKKVTRLAGSISAIAACVVHSLDAAHLMKTAVAARSAGVFSFHMVHDNYGTTAAHAPMLAKVLRQAFVDMYDDEEHGPLAEIQESMSHQLGRPLPEPPERGELNIRSVLEATYFFS